MARPKLIRLTSKQRRELRAIIARPSEAAGWVRRVRVVLLSDAGISAVEIAMRLELSTEAVSRIRRRFHEGGVSGLMERPKPGRKDHAVPATTVERVVQ